MEPEKGTKRSVAKLNAPGRWDITVPEQGDGDDTVLVQFDGVEAIRINAGPLGLRKRTAGQIAKLLNDADATLE